MRLLQSHLFGILAIVAGVVSIGSESDAAVGNPRKSTIAVATSTSAPTAVTWSDGFYGISLSPETITSTITTTGAAQPAATTITTDYTSTLGVSHPVFTTIDTQTFMFSLNNGYTINTAALLLSSSSTLAEGVPPSATSASTGAGTRRMVERDSERRSETQFETTLSLSLADTMYHIVINSTKLINYTLQLMCFRLEWTDAQGAAGYTYSSNITYVNSTDPEELSSVVPLLPYLDATQEAYSASFISQTSAATATGTTATALSTPESTKTSTTASSSTAASSASGQSHGKNGISSGAIAGIVVGVVAVLVIAGLVFFLLRRRRSNAGGLSGSAGGAYRGSGSEQIGLQSGFSSAAVVEKDGFGGGSGAHHGGAHSPYTDDDGVARAGPGALPTAAADHAAANYPTPAPPVLVPAKQATAAPAASPAPPKPAVSGQVAALIEADMTPDDVARLAAEEEELDLAIAKAQQRSRQTSQA